MTIPKNVINPFSDKFEETWALWIAYKWEVHKWKYKGVSSEQMALKHLVDLSDGDEQKAVKIVEQSIRRQWQGFFPLHETSKPNPNGTGKSKKQPIPKEGKSKSSNDINFDDLSALTEERLNKRRQSGNGDYLKAI